MRSHHFGGSRAQNPFAPFAPNNIFARKVGSLPLAASQVPARKVGNQLSYSKATYSYNGEAAPKFYGYSGIGYATPTGTTETKANISSFTPTLWVVSAGTPTQKVTYVNKITGEPEPAGAATNLQSHFEAVPMPDVTKVPGGSLVAIGTDRQLTVWRPSTNEMWEIYNLQGSSGSYTMTYGGYIANVSQFNGILPNNWGANATSLAQFGATITMQDLVEVLRGGSINHALSVGLPVTGGLVAPATRHDGSSLTPELHEGSPNPAFGFVDEVAESCWFRFPPSSHPSEYGITKPLEKAIYEAIREYGFFVANTSGAVAFYMECPLALGSPYSWAKVNPIVGARVGTGGYIPASWTDKTLPVMTEEIFGAASCWTKQPWQTLELLEARTS